MRYMDRPGRASRRFYRLFYQWTLLTRPSSAPRAARTCALHTTSHMQAREKAPLIRYHSRYRNEDEKRSETRKDAENNARPARTALQDEAGESGQVEVQHLNARETTAPNHTSTHLENRPSYAVVSPVERPFSDLRPGDRVVRYMSESSLMFELALLEDSLQDLRKQFGAHLEKLSIHGARTEVQSVSRQLDSKRGNIPQNVLRSILITGTIDEARMSLAHIYEAICGGTPPSNMIYIYFQPVESAATRPFSALGLDELAVRFRSRASVVVEYAVKREVLEECQYYWGLDLSEASKRFGCTIEPQFTTDGTFPPIGSILISGTISAVSKFWTSFVRIRSYVGKPLQSADLPELFSNGKPSNQLTPFAWVERPATSPGSLKPFWELSLTERQWLRLAANHNINIMAGRRRAAITIGEPQQRPISEGSSETVAARSLYIHGYDKESVLKDIIACVRGTMPGSTADGNSAQSSNESGRAGSRSLQVAMDGPARQGLSASGITKPAEQKSAESGAEQLPADARTLQKNAKVGSGKRDVDALTQAKPAEVSATKKPAEATSTNNPEQPSSTTKQDQPSQSNLELAERVITVMRMMTHPVVVVTAMAGGEGTAETKVSRCRGATISSMTTVAMKPVPLISFNMKSSSRTWQAIRKTRKMLLHVLAPSPEGASVAQLFTQGHSDAAYHFKFLQERGMVFWPRENRPPRITSKAVRYFLQARLWLDKCIEVGDHVIVVAEIRAIKEWKRGDDVNSPPPAALSYSGRAYRTQGAEIQPGSFLDPNEKPAHNPRVQSEKLREPNENHDTGAGIAKGNNDVSVAGVPLSGVSSYEPLQKSSNQYERPDSAKSDQVQQHGQDGKPSRTHRPSSGKDARSLALGAIGSGRHTSKGPALSDISQEDYGRSQQQRDQEDADYANDSLYSAMRATREAEDSGDNIDAFQIMNDLDVALGFEDESGDSKGKSDVPARRNADQDDGRALATAETSNSDNLWAPEDVAREDSVRLAERERPAQTVGIELATDTEGASPPVSISNSAQDISSPPASISNSAHETYKEQELGQHQSDPFAKADASASPSKDKLWGLGSIFKRSYTTAQCFPPSQVRHFSSAARILRSEDKTIIDPLELVDPAARNTTVADFLGLPDDDRPQPTHRLRSAVKMNKAAREAERRLAEESEYLTAEEKAELDRTILVNDRIVTKKLAWNAAGDLRIMLDKGRVDFKRAQFFENIIEKGQAVLLEEAKQVRKMLDEGKIDAERFKNVREHLERHNEVLLTETNRLRQLVDDEGEGEIYYPQQGKEP